MKSPRTSPGFTLIELLVVIGIIALLASIAVPAFVGVQVKAAQTKALSNAKQIGLCCKLFAGDNNGQYPSYTVTSGSTSTTTVTDSNSAFSQLIPAYMQTIQLFYQPKSAYTPTASADPNFATDTTTGLSTPGFLPAGKNHWAYVTGLYDTSNSTYPLIADGFASGTSYTATETAKGGVWKGVSAIVVRADDSASIMKVNQSTMKVPGGGDGTDLFSTTSSGWLSSPTNTVVNPL